jgi:prepilin-type N-terminal cleavage/methylation domain-containing protein
MYRPAKNFSISRDDGFTALELLIVIICLGILIALVIFLRG